MGNTDFKDPPDSTDETGRGKDKDDERERERNAEPDVGTERDTDLENQRLAREGLRGEAQDTDKPSTLSNEPVHWRDLIV
jgi:hypothetical protein